MRVLVWQWGRRGAGPRFAAQLAAALDTLPGVEGLLSLSNRAELLRAPAAPDCHLPVATYDSLTGLGLRLLRAPGLLARLTRRVQELRPALAICAMPGPLDLLFVTVLRRAAVPVAVVLHDAAAHPGDGYRFQMLLQRLLVRRADAVVALSAHVAGRLREQRMLRPETRLILGHHPPLDFGAVPPPLAHGGPPRLLYFGRLLPYKGLDLLAEALARLGPRPDLRLRVVGSGPESAALRTLRALPRITVENRWVAESEVGALLGWADALVLPYREASQSGVAAAALAAGRFVIATNVGGLAEQLRVEKLGLLCEPNPAALADTMAAFLDAPPSPGAARDAAADWRALGAQILRDMQPQCGHAAPRAPERTATEGLPVAHE